MLKTNQICLSPLTLSDSAILSRWINKRELVLMSAPYKPVNELQHNYWFKSIQERNDVVVFGIRLLKSNKLIGSCQLHSINPVHRTAELQIRIGEERESRQGHGTEALRLLLKFGFHDLNLNRIYLHVFKTNIPAIRAYEKVGFVREGILRSAAYIDGKYLDITVMGILRNEFSD